ncbi:MAG TPA: ArsR family transcriptional regulator [Candidatus Aenigmarchaeota archaeon]|nr:ArsR family transcriptional regulator [Candidatus Aenigmarchaeota archaeon]
MKQHCEIAFWYILPSIRKELVKALIRKGYKRKDIAKILKISESAIAYYLKDKRGRKFKFSEKKIREIEKAADNIARNKSNLAIETCKLCSKFKKLV